MAYKDKYGITEIKETTINALTVSTDEDLDSNGFPCPCAVLLYTPSMGDPDTHYHIPLDFKEARKLKKWLHKFLKEHKVKGT